MLELTPAKKSRQDSPVGVWLQVEDGSRLSGEFPSSQNLWEIIQTLLKNNLSNYDSPAIIYTRMEIIGKEQLQQKTLKDMGLFSGKALLRLLNKKESEDQAHVYVPAVRKLKTEETPMVLGHRENKIEESSSIEPENLTKASECSINNQKIELMDIESNVDGKNIKDDSVNMLGFSENIDNNTKVTESKKKPILTDEDLNNFKKSISYLDDRDTLLFDIMDGTSVLYQDESDDFFEPTVKDVTLVLRDLKNARSQYEDGQLCTSAMRIIEKTNNQLKLLQKYNKCIIRIHFPSRLVLQSVFKTTETVLDVINFIRKYLVDESLEFCLFTTPPKTILKPEDSLLECECVPSAMIHFSCCTEIDHLKPELRQKIVSGCQASIAAYLVRKERTLFINDSPSNESFQDAQPGPSQQFDNRNNSKTNFSSKQNNTSINKNKMPKWFKPL
ncbi:tether containing UBX domain for GLUT4 isoform X2 [Sipha flava]|nr:tether containing UBX domain for GLUT4 isoform X2 [Sipha flava]